MRHIPVSIFSQSSQICLHAAFANLDDNIIIRFINVTLKQHWRRARGASSGVYLFHPRSMFLIVFRYDVALVSRRKPRGGGPIMITAESRS